MWAGHYDNTDMFEMGEIHYVLATLILIQWKTKEANVKAKKSWITD